ncbi:uncharacterized protein LOC112569178 [Pomacea canaliculata]|uniref:uncharacterized protein LOC112569178 n=1 Tax=Pomacea canaliculata TaxID=400727 RepID=UPI000D733026|nr:uncharacterized protein LOC112569178 [Pomacea canaliculata]
MNVSTTCDPTNQSYKITVSTRTSSGSLEYDGTIIFWKDICTDAVLTSVRCITTAGPAELYRKVNRSHVAIEWQWSLRDFHTGQFRTVQKELKLNVSYPPRVTSLTVDGHEVTGSHLVSEGQEVNISCTFDKGSPPQNLFLMDENGSRLNAVNHQQSLNYLLMLQCKEDWPTILCAGNNSQNNKSVSFIVKCPPQFISKSPSVVDGATFVSWIFSIKTHTRQMHKCFLTSTMFGENSNTAEKCILTGDPPRLLLVIDVEKKKSAKGGNWALILQNEIGSSDMLYFSMPSSDITPSSKYWLEKLK